MTLSQDGWSNIHREPIIATCLHVIGKTILHDAVDVGDTTKDAEYCAQLAKDSIKSAEEKYGCKVIAFVSDSENKMVKAREILQEWRGDNFVYGCAHAREEGGMSKKKSPMVVTGINGLFECK